MQPPPLNFPAFQTALPLKHSTVTPVSRPPLCTHRPHRVIRRIPVCDAAQSASTPPSPPPSLASTFNPDTSALREAILSIAVGKLGEKPIPPSIIPAIATELRIAQQSDAPLSLLYLRASFLGALFVKSVVTPDEHALLNLAVTPARQAGYTGGAIVYAQGATSDAVGVSAAEITATIADPDDSLLPMAHRLLGKETISRAEARDLGQALYSPGSMRPLKAMIAHVMRVRHETADELAGLAEAIAVKSRTARPGVFTERPIALIAEPFDGVITWDLLTPLVCRHLARQYGFYPVMAVGESSGPKYGPNLRDVALQLGAARWGKPCTEDEDTEFGVIADQVDICEGLAEWTWMRRVIVKRPAIATVEKYADVAQDGARLFIASAFHPGYVDKMAVAAEAVGFSSYIIIGKGMEGCIGLGVAGRTSRLLIGWSAHDGKENVYCREELTFSTEGSKDLPTPLKGGATAVATAHKIERYVGEGSSGDAMFDARVVNTLTAIDQAMAILRQRAPHVVL